MDDGYVYAQSLRLLLAAALVLAACTGSGVPTVQPAQDARTQTGSALPRLPTAVPATATATSGCESITGSFGTPVTAQYPTTNLRSPREQQQLVKQGIGTDVANSRIAAIAYLTDIGVLKGTDIAGYATQPVGAHEALVFICRVDKSRLRIRLVQPFPDEPVAIWIVLTYQQADR